MRRLLLALLILALVIAGYAYYRSGDIRTAREVANTAPYSGTALPVLWAQGTTASSAKTQADGVGFDRRGNVFVSGVFQKSVTFAGQELTSRGAGDIFALKFTADGTLEWLKQFGGAGDDNTYDVQADPQGNVILNGWFAKTVDFDGVTLVSEGSQDQFVAKLSPDGKVLWAHRFGGAGGDGGNEVVVDKAGVIYASAMSEGTFTAGAFTFENRGGEDAYIEKVAPDGSVAAVYPTSGSGRERIRAINVDSAGRVFGGYEFWKKFAVGSVEYSSAGSKDGAIVAWDKAGNQLWARHVSSTGDDNVRGIAAGPNGTVYVTGSFGNNATIFGRTVTTVGGADTYLALLGATDGSLKWLMTIGTSGAEEGGEIDSDDAGTLALSTGLPGPTAAISLNGTVVATLPPTPKRENLFITVAPDGTIVSLNSTANSSEGAASGGTLTFMEDGSRVAQVVKYGRSVTVGGQAFTAAGTGESFLVTVYDAKERN